jgi:hypothetical protein
MVVIRSGGSRTFTGGDDGYECYSKTFKRGIMIALYFLFESF